MPPLNHFRCKRLYAKMITAHEAERSFVVLQCVGCRLLSVANSEVVADFPTCPVEQSLQSSIGEDPKISTIMVQLILTEKVRDWCVLNLDVLGREPRYPRAKEAETDVPRKQLQNVKWIL